MATDSFLKYRVPLLCVLLGAVTFVVYLPVCNHEFVRYDDDLYVTENPHVTSGLSWLNVKWAFTTGYASNWHPLTWLSLMLDCTVFGVKSGPLHLVNLAFHITNTLLLLMLLNRLTKRLWPSLWIAALFALHPLHVESVAWVAERKDVLSTLFWLLTMMAYTRYAKHPSLGRYSLTFILFILGLLSKPMLVTLPFVLLLLDYWPLNRIQPSKASQSGIQNLILEKLPFLILAVISCLITYSVQQKGGAMAVIPFPERIANAVVSYLAYIGKMFVPVRLAVLYPYPLGSLPIVKVVVSAMILILVTMIIVYYGRCYKYLIFGWLWYLGTLVPVIGIVQVGVQAMADRYTYIPLIGLFIILAFAVVDLLDSVPFKRPIVCTFAALCLLACALITTKQLTFWNNNTSLFEHTLAVTENNVPILNNYANILNKLGRHAEAAKYFLESLRLRPHSIEIRNNFGNTLKSMGKLNEAVEQYQIVLKDKPDYAITHYNLGIALDMEGKYDEAIEQFRRYLGPDADLPRSGVTAETTERFKKLLASKTDTIEVLSLLGQAFAQKKEPDLAVRYYQQALMLDPGNIVTHGRLALALAALGKIDEAIEHCRIVLTALPNDAEMYNNLGILLRTQGEFNAAIEAFQKSLQIDPNFHPALDNLNALNQKQQN